MAPAVDAPRRSAARGGGSPFKSGAQAGIAGQDGLQAFLAARNLGTLNPGRVV